MQGINQKVVVMDFASSLGKFEGDRVLVKVFIELFHGEGVDILSCSVLDIPWDECFSKGGIEFVDHLLQVLCARVIELHVPAFGEGTGSSFGQLTEKNHDDSSFIIIVVLVYLEVGVHCH